MSARPSVLILHAAGTNRDGEAARACELAGGAPKIVHINQLRQGEHKLDSADILLLPGGFSYGDALGAGVRLALDLQLFLQDELHTFVATGKLILGICNGFQVLVKAGLLPGPLHHGEKDVGLRSKVGQAPPEPMKRSVTLTENKGGRFECRWAMLTVNTDASARWLGGLSEPIFCPVAHGEGNLQVADADTLSQLERENLVAFRYINRDGTAAGGVYPANPNGSVGDIAGLCNVQGNVVGLMPHPEDHIVSIQNPLRTGRNLGLALFEAMIDTV